MKKILCIAFIVMLIPLGMLAAENLVIKMNNGTVLRIPVETIESITFSSETTTPTTPTPPVDPLVGKWVGAKDDTGLGFEFKVNGDFTYSKEGLDLSGTWTRSNKKISLLLGGKEEV